jgi:peptidoglycan hydrolase-like protein with peptidoglycan-binding domain
VVAWQTLLNRWLKLTAPTQTPLATDGVLGPSTQAATQAFQRAQAITPDGIVGTSTRRAMRAALAG